MLSIDFKQLFDLHAGRRRCKAPVSLPDFGDSAITLSPA